MWWILRNVGSVQYTASHVSSHYLKHEAHALAMVPLVDDRKKRANVRTTRKKKNTANPPLSQTMEDIWIEEIVDKINVPPSTDTRPNVIEDTEVFCDLFCCAALGNTTTRVFYTDMTWAFPVTSLENMQAYFLVYNYDTNNIFALPVPNFKDETVITAFEEIYNELKDKGYTSTFNVINNQATTPIKVFHKKEGCKWHFVEPNNYRINTAERAMQTLKNHFIAGLASMDEHCPLQLWDHLTKQSKSWKTTTSAWEALRMRWAACRWQTACTPNKSGVTLAHCATNWRWWVPFYTMHTMHNLQCGQPLPNTHHHQHHI